MRLRIIIGLFDALRQGETDKISELFLRVGNRMKISGDSGFFSWDRESVVSFFRDEILPISNSFITTKEEEVRNTITSDEDIEIAIAAKGGGERRFCLKFASGPEFPARASGDVLYLVGMSEEI